MEIYNEIIAPVIEELVHDYSSSEGVEISYVYKQIKNIIPKIIDEYFSGQPPQINYSNFFVRIGYLHRLLPGLVYNYRDLIKKALSLGYFKEKEIRVIVFGGGPGTELLAISTILKRKNINFCLTDKFDSWADCWDLLKDKIIRKLQNLQISINCDFLPIDITDLNNFYKNKNRLRRNKYYFVNYIVSELYYKSSLFTEFLRAIIEDKPVGEKIVILLADRNQPIIKEIIKEIEDELDLTKKYFDETNIRCPENYFYNLEPIKLLGKPKTSEFKSIRYIFESNPPPF